MATVRPTIQCGHRCRGAYRINVNFIQKYFLWFFVFLSICFHLNYMILAHKRKVTIFYAFWNSFNDRLTHFPHISTQESKPRNVHRFSNFEIYISIIRLKCFYGVFCHNSRFSSLNWKDWFYARMTQNPFWFRTLQEMPTELTTVSAHIRLTIDILVAVNPLWRLCSAIACLIKIMDLWNAT